MKKFTATIEIKKSVIDNVLTTALEGGSNYWYFINESKAEEPENFVRDATIHYEFLDKVLQGGYLPVYDAENNTEELGKLSDTSIQLALQLLAAHHKDVLSNIVDEDYDANDADIFFQLCVLGEITFG